MSVLLVMALLRHVIFLFNERVVIADDDVCSEQHAIVMKYKIKTE